MSKRYWKRLTNKDEKVWVAALTEMSEVQLDRFIQRASEGGYTAALDEINAIIRVEDYRAIYEALIVEQGKKYYEFINRRVKSEAANLRKKEIDPDDPYFLAMREYLDAKTGTDVVTVTENSRKEAIAVIKRAVEEALEQGLGEYELMKLIEKEVRLAWRVSNEFRAQRIARTEVASLANRASLLGVQLTNVPFKKKWQAFIDNRTRLTHIEADGQEADANGFFMVGGAKLFYPADPAGSAAETINCRCHLHYVIE